MFRSPVHSFFDTAARRGPVVALRTRGESGWVEITWAEYARLVRRAARGLMALGVEPRGAVAIIGPNRPEWLIAAVATVAAGSAPAGVYPTSTAEQAAYVVRHAQVKVAVVHDAVQLAKLEAHRAELPDLAHIVLMDGPGNGGDVLSWDELLARGDTIPEAALDERLAAVRGDDVASLIYTSGTTGTPKAVMLSHDNLAFTQQTYADALAMRSEDDHLVSYLPLSHVAEQNLTLFGQAINGYTVSFCPKLELLPDVLREVRPTLFFAVPRVWERIEGRMREAGKTAPWLQRKIGAWAKSVGSRAGHARLEGRRAPMSYPLARRLVFDRVRARLGLDRCKMLVSGAAKIPTETLEYFLSLDLPILEVYGMSENCALTTLNLPHSARLGTVGRVMPGVELKIAEDGEILVRGKHVFGGYLRDEAATREALDPDGWLHTGDVGELDADGFLKITDRKKDLFKTSGGKYVAPAHVEGLLGAIPGVGQAVVIGEGRKTCVALIALDPDAAPKVAETLGITQRELGTLAGDPAFRGYLEGRIEEVNARLARFESVKRFRVLPAAFSVDTGELTPTLKLKRKAVQLRYAEAIDDLYRELEAAP